MRVRLKKKATGGQSSPNKQPFLSPGPNSRQFPIYWPGDDWTVPETDVRNTLQPVDPENANMEAEKGESIYIPDVGGLPAHYDVGGDRHSEGGTPLNVPDNSFIFSDTRSMKIGGPILETFGKSKNTKKKFTPADLAKKYDINKFRKTLADPDSDPLQIKTAEMMIANFNKKLGQLGLVQEATKGFPDGIPQVAMPYLITASVEPEQVLPLKGTPGEDSMQPGASMTQFGGAYTGGPLPYKVISSKLGGESYSWANSPTGGGFFQPGGQKYPKVYTPLGEEQPVDEMNLSNEDVIRRAKSLNSPFSFMNDDGMAGLSKTDKRRIMNAQKYLKEPVPETPEVPEGPATGYWDRVRQFHTGNIPSEEERVKANTSHFERLIPGLGEDTSGPIDYASEALLAVPSIANMMLTGYWELPGTTNARYHPEDTATNQTANLLSSMPGLTSKLATKAVTKGLTYGAKGTKAAAEVIKNVPKAVAKMQQYVVGKYPSLAPAIDKMIRGASSANQYTLPLMQGMAANRSNEYQQGPVVGEVNSVLPPVQNIPPVADYTDESFGVRRAADTPAPINLDSLDEATYKQYVDSLNANKRYGGALPKAQLGVTFKSDGKGNMISMRTGKVLGPDPSYKPKTKANRSTASIPEIAPYHELDQYLDLSDEQTRYASTVATKQRANPKGGYGKQDFASFGTNWKPLLEEFKRQHGREYKPSNKPNDDTRWMQEAMWNTTYNDAKTAGYPEPLARKMANGLTFSGDTDNAITSLDSKHGDWTNSRVRYKFKPYKQATEEQAPGAKNIYANKFTDQAGPINAPWWLQDAVKTAGSAADFLRLKKYLPWAGKMQPVTADATFYDPTRELAANSEQMAIGTQGAGVFSGPQQFSSRFSGIQGQGAKNAADILGRYNNLNVGVANQNAAQNAGIWNHANEMAFNVTKDLYDKTTIANQQFDNSKNMARQELRQSYIDAITNRADIQRENALFPWFNVDPTHGGLGYHTGAPRPLGEPIASTGEDWVKSHQYMTESEKRAWDVYNRSSDPRDDYYGAQTEKLRRSMGYPQ